MIEWAEKENIGPKMEKAKEKIVSAKNGPNYKKQEGEGVKRTRVGKNVNIVLRIGRY